MTDNFRARIEAALVGTYTFERELGGGGMSRTYLAREHALNRRVVVKVLAPELLQGLSIERFKREVLMAAQLQHPHVVPVHSAGDADGLPWFSMPFVDGESLRLRMDRGPVPLNDAIGILRDVARALGYAHSHGIVHRDIKPDNVLLSGGSATVTDFGIAKAISASRTSTDNTTLTQAGMAIGTPAYMAPEQAAADPDLDHRADLYAFGAMAYELLTGQQLFAGRTPARVLAAHLGEAPRDIRELQPDLPPDLADLVMLCLQKDPANRPPGGTAIAQRLDTVTHTAAGTAGSMPLLAPRMRLLRALALWGVASAGILGVTWAAAAVIGLPNWSISGAVAVALAGLPAVLGTWWVQRTVRQVAIATPTLTPGGTVAAHGTMAMFAIKANKHISWTRTWRGGVIAFATLALATTGFLVTRAYGIGPAASLIGAGAFSERETIVVADFRPPPTDTLLGSTVAEALRTDLAQSGNLTVLTRAAIRDILERMLRPRESLVPFALAREIATREGARAIVDGEIVQLGGSYVISARLVSSIDGRELATFRETAEDDAGLVAAVGAMSRSIRERVGESLKGIRASIPLERVTTSSLPALRLYVEATRLQLEGGETTRSFQLLQDAVRIDSTFAMAWRRIAVMLANSGGDREQAFVALRKAMQYRDRLSDDERAQTEGYYYTRGPEPDLAKASAAYEELLRRDPNNSTALNNLAVLYFDERRIPEAIELLRPSLENRTASGNGLLNLAGAFLAMHDTAGVDSVRAQVAERLPDNLDRWEADGMSLYVRGNLDSAAALARTVARAPKSSRQARNANFWLADWGLNRGRPRESLAHNSAARLALSATGDSAAAAMYSIADSAAILALIEGDLPAARELSRRAVAPAHVAALAPANRFWDVPARAAALSGDSATARVALEGFARDQASTTPRRKWLSARMQAYAAFARGDNAGAIAQLQVAMGERASPDVEEAFFVAVAHDRAGRPDSAVAWFERATTLMDGGYFAGTYLPTTHKRLGELYDAKGDLRNAIKWYEAFLDDWTMPEPAQVPVVQAVKARVAELRAKLSPG